MFRLWAKEWQNNHLVRDMVVCNEEPVNRTKKVFDALDTVCREFDLAKPMWLDVNVKDFKRHAKTRFGKDNFNEEISFDYLEIHVIEED